MENRKPTKWLWAQSKAQLPKLIVLIIANVVFAGASVFFAFAVRGVVNGAEIADKAQVTKYAILLGVTVLSQFFLRILINGLSERITAELEMSIKSHLFNKIIDKDYGSINKYHSGELMTRLSSDVSIVADGITSIVPSTVSALSRLIGAVIALVLIDWIFAVAFLVAGVLVFTIITLLRNKLKNLHKKAQKTDGVTRSFMQECIENILAIKVFDANDNISDKSRKLQMDNFRVKMKRRNYSVLGHASYNMIFSGGYIFALIFGVVKIIGGSLDYGSLLAILQLVNNVQVPFASLSNIVPKYFAMTASAERLIEIEDVKEEQKKDPIDKISVYDGLDSVVFDNVCFAYDRDVVLKNTNLTIKKGDFVAITGISGIGKSTLMKLLLGVYAPTEGNIYLKGDFGTIDVDNGTRSLFSYVPQGNLIFSGTIRDNVTFTNTQATDEEIYGALKISGAEEFVKELPDGLDTYIGERGLGLSEGQVQRIAIARAMLSKSSFLLFDEATSALDEETERELLTNLKQLKGVTLIIISHKKSALSICNRHLSIEEGCLKETEI